MGVAQGQARRRRDAARCRRARGAGRDRARGGRARISGHAGLRGPWRFQGRALLAHGSGRRAGSRTDAQCAGRRLVAVGRRGRTAVARLRARVSGKCRPDRAVRGCACGEHKASSGKACSRKVGGRKAAGAAQRRDPASDSDSAAFATRHLRRAG